MSLSRQFRPLFRLLDEPFGRHYPSTNAVSRNSPSFGAFFNDPFFNRSDFEMNLPAVDLTEHANEFVVEAELPGVKKENVEIRIGDGGQSLTIEGKSLVRSSSGPQPEASAAAESQPAVVGDSTPSDTAAGSPSGAGNGSQAITETNKGEVGTPISSERFFSSSSSFSRTVWLPRRVDGAKVKAKLEDGVLTVRIPKAVDPESVRVNVE